MSVWCWTNLYHLNWKQQGWQMMMSGMTVVLLWIVQCFSYVRTSKYEKAVIVKSDRQTYARENCLCEPDAVGRSNLTDLKKDYFDTKFLAMTDWCGLPDLPSDRCGSCLASSPPLGKPPTGFSESDVGRPPNISITLSIQSRDQGLKKRCQTEFGLADRLSGKLAHRLFGGSPGVECDVSRTLDELVSSELETTWLSDDVECCQVFFIRRTSSFGGHPDRNKPGIRVSMPAPTSAGKKVPTPQGCCLTLDSTRFQLCQN